MAFKQEPGKANADLSGTGIPVPVRPAKFRHDKLVDAPCTIYPVLQHVWPGNPIYQEL